MWHIIRRPNLNTPPPAAQRDLRRDWTRGAASPILCAEFNAPDGDSRFLCEATMYIFITILLALLICGFGAGFAFGCRMDPDENRR